MSLRGDGAGGGMIGAWGVNTLSPAYTLDVIGNCRIAGGDNSKTYYGPNSTWGAALYVGAGVNNIGSNTAQVIVTNGNLHLDSGTSCYMYLQWYSNTPIYLGGRFIGNNVLYHSFGTDSSNNQSIVANFQNNVGWIGIAANSTSHSDRVVIGSLGSYGATVGAHNYNLTNWATCVFANGSWQSVSDETVKENIITANYNLCYENIKKIRLVRFNYIEDGPAGDLGKYDKNKLGVIAQELQTIFPKSVRLLDCPTTKKEFLTVDKEQLDFTLFGCVKHMQDIIETQQIDSNNKITVLETQVASLQAVNTSLKEQVVSLQTDNETLKTQMASLMAWAKSQGFSA
jgi:hypothetical protein